MTTALRGKPGSIPAPVPPLQRGCLGYSISDKAIETITKSFVRDLRRIRASKKNYEIIFKKACRNLECEAKKYRLYWTFGRSQKYFNILTKYYFAVAKGYPSKLKAKDRLLVVKWQSILHAPVDSITLSHVKRFAPHLVKGIYWGWNMTDSEYRDIQCKIRELASSKGLCPLAYEIFAIW